MSEEEKKFEKVDSKKLKEEEKKIKEKSNKKEKKDKKKSKISLKIILPIIIVAALVIGIVSAVVIGITKPTPQKSLNNALNAIKNADVEKVNKYIDYNEIMESSELFNKNNDEIQKALFEKLSWKIGKTTKNEEENSVSVEVEITNKDFGVIIKNYMDRVLKAAVSGERLSNEEFEKFIKEELSKQDINTVSTTKNVEMVKVDGNWIIKNTQEFASVLLPGLEEAINSIQ